MKTKIRAFVQARMSSQRYPGKVLAPFRGEPIIRHVVRAVEQVLPREAIVVVTSSEVTDDPLAAYVESTGVSVFRGPLDNVVERFRICLKKHPSEWLLRINGDSPLLSSGLIRLVLRRMEGFQGDLITTIFPRTFPKGQNAEAIRATSLNAIAEESLTKEEEEHVTPYFYRHPDRFHILNVESGDPAHAAASLAVDTIEDLQYLERLSQEELQRLMPPILGAVFV